MATNPAILNHNPTAVMQSPIIPPKAVPRSGLVQPGATANDPAWRVGCVAVFGAMQGRGSSLTFGRNMSPLVLLLLVIALVGCATVPKNIVGQFDAQNGDFIFSPLLAASETSIENSTPQQLAAHVGKVVSLEGLAWGKGWPELGERVILASGTRVFLQVSEGRDSFPNGRLVRVTGVVARRHLRAAQGMEAGYSEDVDYWLLESPKIEVLTEVVSSELSCECGGEEEKAQQ